MALIRQSGIFNMDGGQWFNEVEGKGTGVTQAVAAARYTNIANFRNLVNDTAATWETNQWGDQGKRLAFSKFGYNVVDVIWTQGKAEEQPYDASPLAADSFVTGTDAPRLAVIRSLSNGHYLFVDPTTAGGSANQVKFAWTSSHTSATRFSDLSPITGWLTNSVLGDDDNGLTAGFEIEFYVFTQIRDTKIPIGSFFSGGPTGPRDIQRAFLPYSKERGKYLFINDISLPPDEMVFSFTSSKYEAVRFDNTTAFTNIINANPVSEKFGWELPQVFFNGNATPIKANPFEQFWCIDGNFPDRYIFGDTCGFLCDRSTEKTYLNDFQQFLNDHGYAIINPKNYSNPKAFDAFWGRQDINDFIQWLYEKYVSCGGQGRLK